jgi:hypothetical protein
MGYSDILIRGIFFRKVAYTMYDVSWFIEWMNFNSVMGLCGVLRGKEKG